MRFEGSSLFAKAIEEHLELKRRNAHLDPQMPLARYRNDDPFTNHPLFKTEEQARWEETQAGTDPSLESSLVLAGPAYDVQDDSQEDSFWGRSRDFDWGR
ncbi:MAG: hypothetical protein R3C15_02955 [Thermoleophilia bacterium]